VFLSSAAPDRASPVTMCTQARIRHPIRDLWTAMKAVEKSPQQRREDAGDHGYDAEQKERREIADGDGMIVRTPTAFARARAAACAAERAASA